MSPGKAWGVEVTGFARGGRGVGALPFRYKIYSLAGQASILHFLP